MERLKVLSGRDVAHILQQNGFTEVRRHGSHILMQRTFPAATTQTAETNGVGTITVPVPDHHELKRGTLMSIIRQSQVAREHFEGEEP